MTSRIKILAVALLAMFLWVEQSHAQWNNNPYQKRGVSEGVGMSPAYRQAILDQQLRNSQPRNLYRTADGLLLSVERDSAGQAFVSVPSERFVTRSRPSQQRGAGFGFRTLGGERTGSGISFIAESRASRSMSPIDAWTRQLEELGR